MSLKSFDKFCGKMVNNEPINEKTVFDERQNQLRLRYTLEALIVFASASFLNTLIMECGGQWCESYVMPMVLFAAVSYLYWVMRNAVKATLFGIHGPTTGIAFTAFAVMNISIFFPETSEEWSTFFINNGVVGVDFVMVISDVLFFCSGLAVLIAAHKFKKSRQQSIAE
ncbi:MAG: hypothetical protein ACI4XA_06280 [Oscillospiraceae bacterium]